MKVGEVVRFLDLTKSDEFSRIRVQDVVTNRRAVRGGVGCLDDGRQPGCAEGQQFHGVD